MNLIIALSTALITDLDMRLVLWVIIQMTVIAVATYALILVARNTAPSCRAFVGIIGLLCMATLPITMLVQSRGWSLGDWIPAPNNVEQKTAFTSAVDSASGSNQATTEPTTNVQTAVNATATDWWQQALVTSSSWFQERNNEQPTNQWSQSTDTVPSWFPLFIALAVCFGFIRLAIGTLLVHRLRRTAIMLDDPEFEAAVDACAKQMGVPTGISIAESTQIGSAAIIGWLRPIFLLPANWRDWTNDERLAVIAHELAHVRRRDYMATAIAQTTVAMNFFHPLAHALVARVRLEQELAADTLAATHVGGPQRYIEILAGLALRQPEVRTPGPAQAFLPPRRMFVRRLEMLRALKLRGPGWSQLYTTSASIAVIFLSLLATGLRPIEAQDKPARATATAAKQQDIRSLIPPSIIEGVVEIDMPALLASPGLKPLMENAAEPLQQLPFDPSSIQSVLVMMPTPGERPPLPEPLVVVRFKEGIRVSEEMLGPTSRQVDSQTLVVGGPRELRDVIGTVPSDNQFRPFLARHDDQPIRAVVKTEWMRTTVNREGPPIDHPLWAFSPLWDKVDTMSLGVELSEDLIVTGQIDASQPQQVADTLIALKTLGRNYLARLAKPRDSDSPSNPMEAILLASVVSQATQLLDSIKISAADKQVNVSAKLDSGVYTAMTLLLPAVQSARGAARRTQAANNLKQILLAMHNYHSAYGHLPTAVMKDKESGVERSWRIDLLPFLDQAQLWNQYAMNEPWDSPNNLKVLEQMPAVYAAPGIGGSETPYQAVVSEGAALLLTEDGEMPDFRHIIDGLSNTIFVVETQPMVPWTKPVDFSKTGVQDLIPIRPEDNIINVGFGDGSVRAISLSITQSVWKALLTKAGGEIGENPPAPRR